jgi:chromosome segregation ATPase
VEAFAIVLTLVLLFFGGAAAVVGLVVVKAKRAVGRAAPQARRAVEDVGIKARSLTRSGVHGQVAALRSEVRSALTASRRVLEDGAHADGQLAEATALLGRLEGHAAELDTELRQLELEADTERVRSRFAAAKERGDRIVHLASSLKWAAQDRQQRHTDDDLTRLAEECAAEAGALRHWAPAELEPDRLRKA